MLFYKQAFFTLFFAGFIAVSFSGAGCAKEYSYERVPQDSIVKQDSIKELPFLSPCTACNSSTSPADSTWSFKLGQSLLCGYAEKAIITLDRRSFTFFGPSSCSADTGFIATVYLETQSLDADKANVVAAKVVFYYYDRVTPSYVLVSQSDQPFTLTIDSYKQQTGIAIGHFSGNAYTVNGIRKEVSDGKFRICFR